MDKSRLKPVAIAVGLILIILLFIFCGRQVIGATEPLNIDTASHVVISPTTIDFSTATVLGLTVTGIVSDAPFGPPWDGVTVTAPSQNAVFDYLNALPITNWNTAYTDRLKWDGGATGLVAATGRTSLGLVIGTNVEAWLGNPSTDGYVLSSTAAGARSWVAPATGGLSLPLAETLTFATDTTYDIGTSTVRPRSLYLADRAVIAGRASIGTTSSSVLGGLYLVGSGSAGSSRSALLAQPVFPVSASSLGSVLDVLFATTASAFTMANGYGVWVRPPNIGAGSAVTNLYGTRIANQGNAGVANAYGLYIDAQSGSPTTNIGLYNGGTSTLADLLTAQNGISVTGGVISGNGSGLTNLNAEPPLGNPSTNGYVLSSTTAGVRSWIAQATGGVTSVFTRTGAVVAASGDYSIGQITGANATNWDTAYTDRLKWDGGATGLVAATGRSSLGLVIGSNVEAWDTDLDTWATKTPYAGTLTITSGKTLNAISSITIGGTDGKTLTVSNNIQLSGTDGANLNVGNGGALGSAAFTPSTNYAVAAAGLPTGGTSGQVLQKNTSTNYDASWVAAAGGGNVSNSGTPTAGQDAQWTDSTHIKGVSYASLQTTSASPSGTTSTGGVMAGLGGTITPTATGKILVTISGSLFNNSASGGASCAIRYGTGTVPANGAVLTGTQIGGSASRGIIAANERMPFSLSAVITGLALGTQVWLDLNQTALLAGTAALSTVSIAAVELP
jgi:hypothetical protein